MKADGASVTVAQGDGPTAEVLRAGRTHLLGEETGGHSRQRDGSQEDTWPVQTLRW